MRRVIEMNRIFSQYELPLIASQLLDNQLSEEKLKENQVNE
jgi:hypothetical protein